MKNVIIGDLHRVKILISNFEQDGGIIRNKYTKTGYPFCFINSLIDGFNQEKEDPLVSTSLFKKRKEVSFQIPLCKWNENYISCIIDKLEAFTNYKVEFRYFRKTKIQIKLDISLSANQALFIRVPAHVVNFM